MPFITQGKTNWKFLLIVFILAVIIGGGILVYLYCLTKETTVSLVPTPTSTSEVPGKPYIKLISPNGGENLKVGDTYNIKWESNGIEKLMIELTNYSCCSETPVHIAEEIPVSQGSYSWKIPDYGWSPEDNLKVFMVGDDNFRVQDESDNYFHIYFSIPSMPETANWKTYRNDKYRFEIKYPDGTKIMDSMTGSLNPATSTNISMLIPSSLKGILKELNIDIDSLKNSPCPKKAPFVINGVNFSRTDVSGDYVGMESDSAAMEYCTMKDNVPFRLITLLSFSKYEHPPFDKTTELEIVNQTLSTFRFIEYSKAQENTTDGPIRFDPSQTWINTAESFGSTESNNQQKCAISPQKDIYCVIGRSLLNSKDGGRTWNEEKFTSEQEGSESSPLVLSPTIVIDSKNVIHIVWTHALEFLGEHTSLQYYEIRYRTKDQMGWSEEMVISSTKSVGTGSYNFPNHPIAALALDSQDNVYVVWSQNSGHQSMEDYYPFSLRYRSKMNKDWKEEEIVDEWKASSDYIDSAPAIAIDSHNNVHIVWDQDIARDSGNYIFYRKRIQYSWEAKEKINEKAAIDLLLEGMVYLYNPSYNPDIAIDSKDNIYIVWEQRFSSGEWGDVGGSKIVLREKTSSGWMNIEFVSGSTGQSDGEDFREGRFGPQWGRFPSISIDYLDAIHVVWQDVGCRVWGSSEDCERISYRKKKVNSWSDVWAYTPVYEGFFNFFPNLIWARWPELNGTPINVLNGYAFVTSLPKTFPRIMLFDYLEEKFNAFIIDDSEIARGIFGF